MAFKEKGEKKGRRQAAAWITSVRQDRPERHQPRQKGKEGGGKRSPDHGERDLRSSTEQPEGRVVFSHRTFPLLLSSSTASAVLWERGEGGGEKWIIYVRPLSFILSLPSHSTVFSITLKRVGNGQRASSLDLASLFLFENGRVVMVVGEEETIRDSLVDQPVQGAIDRGG